MTLRSLLIAGFACSALDAAPAEIRSGCEENDEIIATVPDGTPIRVRSAIAGGSSCYSVTADLGQRTLNGYVIDATLPVVVAFENERRDAFRRAAVIIRPSSEASAAPAPPQPVSRFPDFEARDLRGKPVSLASLRGKVIVVTFWSPSNPKTLSQVTALRGLYTEFHRAGLDAIGVAMTGSDKVARKALDDTELDWPQISDQAGLARALNITGNEAKTFVLDANRNVVAADLQGGALNTLVMNILQKR